MTSVITSRLGEFASTLLPWQHVSCMVIVPSPPVSPCAPVSTHLPPILWSLSIALLRHSCQQVERLRYVAWSSYLKCVYRFLCLCNAKRYYKECYDRSKCSMCLMPLGCGCLYWSTTLRPEVESVWRATIQPPPSPSHSDCHASTQHQRTNYSNVSLEDIAYLIPIARVMRKTESYTPIAVKKIMIFMYIVPWQMMCVKVCTVLWRAWMVATIVWECWSSPIRSVSVSLTRRKPGYASCSVGQREEMTDTLSPGSTHWSRQCSDRGPKPVVGTSRWVPHHPCPSDGGVLVWTQTRR